MRWKTRGLVSDLDSEDPPPPGSWYEDDCKDMLNERISHCCAVMRLLIDSLNDLDDAHVVAAGESILPVPEMPTTAWNHQKATE